MEQERLEENELLRKCQAGDESAFAELMAIFQQRVYGLAFRVLGDAARAEDAAADALANMWFRCRSWRGQSGASTWVYQVALRTVLDHARQRKRWWRFWELNGAVERPTTDVDPATWHEQQDEHVGNARRVAAALAELPPNDRALVHLHYFEQQSLAEIAEVMGVSRDALKMRLARLRQRLREKWQDNDES